MKLDDFRFDEMAFAYAGAATALRYRGADPTLFDALIFWAIILVGVPAFVVLLLTYLRDANRWLKRRVADRIDRDTREIADITVGYRDSLDTLRRRSR